MPLGIHTCIRYIHFLVSWQKFWITCVKIHARPILDKQAFSVHFSTFDFKFIASVPNALI